MPSESASSGSGFTLSLGAHQSLELCCEAPKRVAVPLSTSHCHLSKSAVCESATSTEHDVPIRGKMGNKTFLPMEVAVLRPSMHEETQRNIELHGNLRNIHDKPIKFVSTEPVTPNSSGAHGSIALEGPAPISPEGLVPSFPGEPAPMSLRRPANFPGGPAPNIPGGPVPISPGGPVLSFPGGPASNIPGGPAPNAPERPVPGLPDGEGSSSPKPLSNRDLQLVRAFELMERTVLLLEQIANPAAAPEKALKNKLWEDFGKIVSGAMAVVASLAWRDFFQQAFDLGPIGSNELLNQFVYAITMSAISVVAIFFIITLLGKLIEVNYRKQMKIFYENLDDWFPRIAKKANRLVLRSGSLQRLPRTPLPADVQQRDLFDATRLV